MPPATPSADEAPCASPRRVRRLDPARSTPAATSCSARRAGFGDPSTFGTQPSSNCRARAAATVTNSNEFFGRDGGRDASSICSSLFRPRVDFRGEPEIELPSQVHRQPEIMSLTISSHSGRRRSRLRPLGRDDRRNFRAHAVELVVDDDVVVCVDGRDFAAGRRQPPLDRRRRILAAPAQPLLEHLERRRQHEDADRVRRPARGPAWRPGRRSRARDRRRRRAALPCRAGRCRTGCRRRRPTRGTRRGRPSRRTRRG